MKYTIKQISTFPVNDRKVYVSNSSGVIFERTGVIVKFLESNTYSPFRTAFVDETGSVMNSEIEEDWNDAYEKLGVAGTTITPYDISKAIDINLRNNCCQIEEVFEFAEEYFTIDKSGAEDTVKIRISVGSNGANFECESKWYGFPRIEGINLKDPEYKGELFDTKFTLENVLVAPLVFYAEFLGRPINLDIDFKNYYEGYHIEEYSDDKIQLRNDEIDIYRRKYLADIREFIEKKFIELRDQYKIDPKTIERRKALKEKFEFANQDGKMIPLSI